MTDRNAGLTRGGMLVVAMLALLGSVFLVGWKARGEAPTQSDLHELAGKIDGLADKLDHFNTRLSWLEGATSGAVRPPPGIPVQTSGPSK